MGVSYNASKNTPKLGEYNKEPGLHEDDKEQEEE